MSAIAQNIKDLRLRNNLTQKQLAEKLNLAISAVSSYELGTRLPSYDVLKKLSQLFNVSTDYLLGLENRKVLDVTGLDDDEIEVVNKMIALLKDKKKQEHV